MVPFKTANCWGWRKCCYYSRILSLFMSLSLPTTQNLKKKKKQTSELLNHDCQPHHHSTSPKHTHPFQSPKNKPAEIQGTGQGFDVPAACNFGQLDGRPTSSPPWITSQINEPNLTQLIVKKKFAPPSNCHISAAHQKIKIWYLPSTLVFFLVVGHRFWSFQECLAVSVLHHYEVRWCFQTRWFDGLETRSFSALYSIISSMFYASFFLSNTCLGVFLSKPKPTKSGMKKLSGTK